MKNTSRPNYDCNGVKLEIGDEVERISTNEYNYMFKGDKDVITGFNDNRSLILKKYGIGHAGYAMVKVREENEI